jgi:hypothetical protein
MMHPNDTAGNRQPFHCTSEFCMKADADDINVLDLSGLEIEDPATQERMKKAISLFLNKTESVNTTKTQ